LLTKISLKPKEYSEVKLKDEFVEEIKSNKSAREYEF
jgi:hypothetical protein